MPVWSDSRMTIAYYNTYVADEDLHCEVRIDGSTIVVSYRGLEEEGLVVYKGKKQGEGHYVLDCPDKQGKATLHHLENSIYLTGYWTEVRQKGFWRITLRE
jgi:hypothetical protein